MVEIHGVSKNGVLVAPHAAAAEAGAEVLRAGGSAVEAMVAAASTIAVVYPHMNGIGGDGFWIIAEPGRPPVAVEGCGPAGAKATIAAYNEAGHDQVPSRGPLAALTVPGTIGGWNLALELAEPLGSGMPLGDLLAPAIAAAKDGITVSRSQAALTAEKLAELQPQPGFADVFLADGKAPDEGSRLKQPRLADTLDHLSRAGLGDFYRGDVGATLARDLDRMGSPVTEADIRGFEARRSRPLSVKIKGATLFNTPPPTQGLAALLILAIFDQLGVKRGEGFDHVHGIVEATKRAFLIRNAVVTDPRLDAPDIAPFLSDASIRREVASIDMKRAAPWPDPSEPGDTIWMGAIDRNGVAVSFIQSVFWEFGSGAVSPGTGVLLQNRGSSFALRPDALNALRPGRRPFHTLNPALARFDDGRVLSYGSMGGDGQPQFQAQLFTRMAQYGVDMAEAVARPRWLLGKTWGSDSSSLKVEHHFDTSVVEQLNRAGHFIEVVPAAGSDNFGHAGAVRWRPGGDIEGVHDPRADGGAGRG